tara:strand:+ start:1421 stop:1930 length:510 start_codon:yes stop_codon:yes gene_type:complete
MGLPFKESLTTNSVAKQFSSIQLTQSIFNSSNQTTPFDIGTGGVLSGYQTGLFAVTNENASLYNNNGGFIIRKKGFYKIELSFRMIDSFQNPQLNIKKNNVIFASIILACFSNKIVGTNTTSMTFTILSNIIDCNIGDVITFEVNINSSTSSIVGHPTNPISYINIIEI